MAEKRESNGPHSGPKTIGVNGANTEMTSRLFATGGSSAIPRKVRLVVLLAVFLAYAASFPFLFRLVGNVISGVGFLPAAVAGWLFGMRPGLVVAALVCLLNALPLFPGAYPNWNPVQAVIGSLAMIAAGGIVGHARDLGERWRRELIARARAEKSLERSNRELTTLCAIAQALANSVNLDDVLRTALDRSLEALVLPVGGIYLMSDDGKELHLAICSGIGEETEKELRRLPVGTGVAGEAAATGETVVINDIPGTSDPACVTAVTPGGIRAAVAVPLKSKGTTLGVLTACANTERAIAEEDVTLMKAIASQIGSAIHNAQLYERMSQLSLTDELTGLSNRRRFDQSVQAEILRAKRDGKPFCLMMLDLDSFKTYNDCYGHLSGDLLLKGFARNLGAALRKTDTAFRLGGDEFSIVLPGTPSEVAWKVIDRVRSSWQAEHSRGEYSGDMPVGFSVGIAEFPRDGPTADDLTSVADATLYELKSFKQHATIDLGREAVQGK